MELSWPIKLRVAASLLTGILLIGIFAWPVVAPDDPLGVVSAPNTPDAAILATLAIFVGFAAYFVCWPHGKNIAILAVPAGLAVWACRSGNMAILMQQNPAPIQRQAIFDSIRFQSIFWLAIVAAGFLGVFLAHSINSKKEELTTKSADNKANLYLTRALTVVLSAIIAHIFIRMLAQDFSITDTRLGSVVAQPGTGQIAFALIVAFAVAAFVAKKFLHSSYIWPIIAGVILSIYSLTTYAKEDTLRFLSQNWPPNFFTHPSAAILPIQMVAFAALGAIIGHWAAIRFEHWRKHDV